ncbi:MAG: hypothetical protein ACRENB_01590, partial [Gemmatimonadales bacterium]
TPGTTSLQAAQTVQFSVSTSWSDGTSSSTGVTYSAQGGTITSGGLYTAGAVGGTYRVIAAAANGPADTSYVTVVVPTATLSSLSLTPASVILAPGAGQQFAVSGSWSDGGSSVPSVTYSATGGAVTSAGYYTAGGSAGTFRVIATHAPSGKADTSFVTVTAPSTLAGLTVSPGLVSLAPGAAKQFTLGATWSNGSTTPPAVTWTATGGTISTGGLYVAGLSGGAFRVIAKQQGGTLADTADVSISGAVVAPTLTGIVTSPASATVLTGGAQQFTAQAQYSDGTTGIVPVTWSATGGTISSIGLYVAGSTPGTYRVISTEQGGKADTSVVTVVVPLPPSPGGFNEPAGLGALNTRGFNSVAADDYDKTGAEGWDAVEGRSLNFTVVADAAAPLSASKVMQTRYPAGMNGGVAPGTGQYSWSPGAGHRKLYHRFAIKASSNFAGHSTTTNKLFHIWVGGQNRVFYRLVGSGSNALDFQVALQGVPDARTRFTRNVAGTSSIITRGQWYTVEVVLQLNTAGVADGTIDFWINGSHIGRYTDVQFLGGGEGAMTFHQIQWSPTWGGGGGTVPADMYLWLDHSYASAR